MEEVTASVGLIAFIGIFYPLSVRVFAHGNIKGAEIAYRDWFIYFAISLLFLFMALILALFKIPIPSRVAIIMSFIPLGLGIRLMALTVEKVIKGQKIRRGK